MRAFFPLQSPRRQFVPSTLRPKHPRCPRGAARCCCQAPTEPSNGLRGERWRHPAALSRTATRNHRRRATEVPAFVRFLTVVRPSSQGHRLPPLSPCLHVERFSSLDHGYVMTGSGGFDVRQPNNHVLPRFVEDCRVGTLKRLQVIFS